MGTRIEDYALIGNTMTAALVCNTGSIDWLCLPRFDSPACFAALLGKPENGRWRICPKGEIKDTRRWYRGDSLILETEFRADGGIVRVIDFMPVPHEADCHDLIRIVEGVSGEVEMEMEVAFRFDYGSIAPWLRRPTSDWQLSAIAGPDAVHIHTTLDLPERLGCEDNTTRTTFTVRAGERVPFVLNWHASHIAPPPPADAEHALRSVEDWWREWSSHHRHAGPWRDATKRSLVTLKGLIYSPTGGIVAAPTTSLPEKIGGTRNWDYRFCWVRDATMTLYVLLHAGYRDEAIAWREWLLRAVAGEPHSLNIMYGIAGERRLTELELPWLDGFAGSRPVRIGNDAHRQLQIDVYGEVMDAFHAARKNAIEPYDEAWAMQKVLLDALEGCWAMPDEGIWEVRGPRRHFTHSKVMAWVAADRMVKAAEDFGLEGPVDRWRALRDEIRKDVLEKGYDAVRNTFVQYYGGRSVDAALLMIPMVGFLPAEDERVKGTVAAIERELMSNGLLMRYVQDAAIDGLPPGEGAFLACNFWYVDNLLMMGRRADADAMFRRLLDLRNDVGLLAEEYDPADGRMLGNFPQAFSHIALVNTAHNMARLDGEERGK